MTVKVSKPAINVREELADLRKPTGLAGEAMLRAETPQEQFNLIGAARKNMLYNGAMVISQRGTSETFTTAGNEYVLDRFYKLNGSSYAPNITVSQQADAPSGFTYSMKVNVDGVTTPTSNQNLLIGQSLEGYDVAQLGYGTATAKSITISFWVKANQTGSRGVYFMTTDVSRDYMAEFNINQSGTWEYKTITIPPNTIGGPNIDNSEGLRVLWPLSTGSSDKINASTEWENIAAYRGLSGEPDLCDTVGNYFQITGIQLEVGPATPFEHRSYGEELALAQRYFETIKDNRDMICVATSFSNQAAYGSIDYKVEKRATPTITFTGGASNYRYRTNGNNRTLTSIGVSSVNDQNFRIDMGVGVGNTVASHSGWLSGASGATGIQIDAEL